MPIFTRPDINTSIYTNLVIKLLSPSRYSTKLKFNRPTKPQLIQPIILRVNVILYNVFMVPPF